jgi:hypothetical protein
VVLKGYNSEVIAPMPHHVKKVCIKENDKETRIFRRSTLRHWKEMSGQFRAFAPLAHNSTAGFDGNDKLYVFCR